ncbi:hypothetical protein DFH07DRAFT_734172 [Mycena maculata]|uniref:protein-tyrosine-phosphatase n=1 Tax=Mycena maculata TaxID=230809 RepID=A0AAD7NRA1_9AGAR|nr:hypothetical protein DFH07DRAFT_734172 [Mycena maculata]
MNDDFFSVVGTGLLAPTHPPDDIKQFQDAIAQRFGVPDQVQTARLLVPPIRMPLNTPLANLTIGPPEKDSPYTAVPPSGLSQWLDDPSTLVVDIRPHAAYSSARISRAVSLSVPSTLLKRPLFSLQRLSAMLPSHSARTRFGVWRNASRILVYDADSMALSETSNIQGLLRKFRAEAPHSDIPLAWVQGGFQAVWAHRRDCVDIVPPSETETETEDDDEDDEPDDDRKQKVLRAHHLPRAAFALASTTQAPGPRSGKYFRPALKNQPTSTDRNAGPPFMIPRLTLPQTSAQEPAAAFNPFFDAVRQNTELSHGITERIPLRLPRRVRRRISELPFQWLRDIARRAGPVTPPAGYLPVGSPRRSPSSSAIEEGTEALAMQFYRIELAEQRRLMGVMAFHSRESGGHTHSPFPFSITAGVEKGSKNRYRNIWPFEHARVRLHRLHSDPPGGDPPSPEHDDYVNASHVQPLGTRRRYIATQGPLDATFGDFWTLVWQQNTHIIVMLTREVEGAMIKCGAYWRPGTYGPLRVELLGCGAEGCGGVCQGCAGEGDGVSLPGPAGGGAGGFFAQSAHPTTAPQLIKRTLRLTHAAHPRAPPRKVVQLQYLGWPDMNVPEDARGVLGLVWEVGRAVDAVGKDAESSSAADGMDESGGADGSEETAGADSDIDEATGVLRRALRAGDAAAPVVLHCSAGVGRTGGFIAVDAVLDAVRMEAREMYVNAKGRGEGGISEHMRAAGIVEGDRMDVDTDTGAQGYQAEGRGMRTPMQVDSVGGGAEADDDVDMGKTRRWAERVADTKMLSAFGPATVPGTAASSAFSSAFPSAASSPSPFQFQAPATAHRATFSLTLPTAHLGPSADTGTGTTTHAQNPENKSASLPAKPGRKAAHSPLPGKVLSESPLAGSPLPDRPLGRSPSAVPPPGPTRTRSFEGPAPAPAADAPSQCVKHVDYKEPRALHGRDGCGPVRLSDFEDPIWEVVQDMREQRMSLCQSLRQYVFVHAAIIEGALMVVDEERARAGVAWRPSASGRPARPALFLTPSDDTQSTTSSTGKRLASPTELLKEDKKGEIVLSKRPSIKRKQPTADEYAYSPPLPTFPPP